MCSAQAALRHGQEGARKVGLGWMLTPAWGFASPRCAVPYGNGTSGLVGGQLSAEKGPRAVRNTDTPHGIRWLKSKRLRLANLFTFIAAVAVVLDGSRWTK